MQWLPVSEFTLMDNAMVAGYEMKHWAQSMAPTWLVEVCCETACLKITTPGEVCIISGTRVRSTTSPMPSPLSVPQTFESVVLESLSDSTGPLSGPPAPTAAAPVVDIKKGKKK
jgi:hypothetical protein